MEALRPHVARLQHKRGTSGLVATRNACVRPIAAVVAAPSATNKPIPTREKQIQAVVIGGGIGGLLAAHSLARYVDRVVLLEKDPAGSARIEEETFSQVNKACKNKYAPIHLLIPTLSAH